MHHSFIHSLVHSLVHAGIKSGKSSTGGSILGNASNPTDAYFNYFARYLSRSITAYRQSGVDLFAITTQNEPYGSVRWDSDNFTPEMMRDFIAYHLGPVMRSEQKEVMIIAHDDQRNVVVKDMQTIMSDPRNMQYVDGMSHRFVRRFVHRFVHRLFIIFIHRFIRLLRASSSFIIFIHRSHSSFSFIIHSPSSFTIFIPHSSSSFTRSTPLVMLIVRRRRALVRGSERPLQPLRRTDGRAQRIPEQVHSR